jgi:hypothetical protein
MKPLQIGYDPIPDVEDVTPYNRPIAKKVQSSYTKFIWVRVILL